MTPLDHAGIAARIPHSGRMCLLASMAACDASGIHCIATSHRDPQHPLRGEQGLSSAVAIEYAAQAMALHGALNAAAGTPPSAGFLASARAVHFAMPYLDGIAGPLHVRADLQAGDPKQAMYRFRLHTDDGRTVAEGRATVVLNTPLPT